MNDQLVAEAAAYTTHNGHKRLTFLPPAELEPAMLALKWPQIYVLDRTPTGIGSPFFTAA
jgi:hypothetical protein